MTRPLHTVLDTPIAKPLVSSPLINTSVPFSIFDSNYGKSTITPAEPNFLQTYSFDKIRQDSHLELRCIRVVDEMQTLGRTILLSTSLELESVSDRLKDHMLEQAKLLCDIAETSSQNNTPRIASKIASYLYASYSMAYGILLLNTGHSDKGIPMIGASFTSIANLVMTEAQGWNALANTISPEDDATKQSIAYYSPLAAGFLASAVNTSIQAAAMLDPSVANLSLYPQAMTALGSIGPACQGSSDMQIFRLQAQLTELQQNLNNKKYHQEDISSWTKNFMHTLHEIDKQLVSLIQNYTATLKQVS